MNYCPGPGDSVTWGRPRGHPHDPRTCDMEDDFDWPVDTPEPEDDDWDGEDDEAEN